MIRRTTYLEMEARLLAQVPELGNIAVFNGQPDAMKAESYEDLPYRLPAVFVQLFGGDAVTQTAGTREYPEYIFRLHLVTERYTDDYNGAPGQTQALARFDLLEKVLNAIDRWAGATYVAQFRVLQELLDDAATHIVHDTIELYGILQDCSLAEDLEGTLTEADDYEINRIGRSEYGNVAPNTTVLPTPFSPPQITRNE